MAKQLKLKNRRYWILSEPHAGGWKATVDEVKDDGQKAAVGIEATGETRGTADDAAEQKLRRMLTAY
jgi:hypothetical protein